MTAELEEFKYLTAPRAASYRAVMAFFHQESLRGRHAIPPDELARLMEVEDAQVPEVLLDQLVRWGNLRKRRDSRSASSLAEYARRRDLYLATPRGLSIENFLVAGLDVDTGQAVVDARAISEIEAMVNDLVRAVAVGVPDPDVSERRWSDLQRLLRDLSDDVRALGQNVERKLLLEDKHGFVEFKDAVHSYVLRLSRELTGPGRRTRALLEGLQDQLPLLYDRLVPVRAARTTTGGTLVGDALAREQLSGEWNLLYSWFTRSAQDGDGMEFTLESLGQAVRKVLRHIDAIHRTRELGLGRSGDLTTLARTLQAQEHAEAAREMLAHTLAVFAPLHFSGTRPSRRADDTWASPGEPLTLVVSKTGRPKAEPLDVLPPSGREAAEAARQAGLARERHEQALLSLLSGNVTSLHGLQLPDLALLRDILGWISLVGASGGGWFRARVGAPFTSGYFQDGHT
jgi:uncharacterized protein (TIGR02677 family)